MLLYSWSDMKKEEIPMIWTSKGNLPIEILKHITKWEEEEGFIKFTESYFLDGEIVKSSSHIYVKQGIDSLLQNNI